MRKSGYATRAALARASGISESTIGRWISGTNEPSISYLRIIAPLLDLRLGDLIVNMGLATAAELGHAGSPPPPLPPVIKDIMALLTPSSPLTEKEKRILQNGHRRTHESFMEWYADKLVGLDPRGRS